MNAGNGLNGSTGTFRAPKSGIYRFWFNGLRDWNLGQIHIELRVNGICVGNAYSNGGHGQSAGAVVHAVVKLKLGDEVHLFKAGGGSLYDDDSPDTHYSGWLVDEELNN